jgi:hypothetical protein
VQHPITGVNLVRVVNWYLGQMAPREVSPYVDQVPRRLAFEHEHPDIKIRPPGHGSYVWSATVPGVGDLHALDLRRLLDKLLGVYEEYGQDPPNDTSNAEPSKS